MLNRDNYKVQKEAGAGGRQELHYLVLDLGALKCRNALSPALAVLLENLRQAGSTDGPQQAVRAAIRVVDFAKEPQSFVPSESLCLADCQETVDFARRWDMAVLGYEPQGQERRIRERLPLVVEDFDEVDETFLQRVYQRYHHLPWTVLTTRRCVVREMTVEDLGDLYALYAPPEITRYMAGLHAKKSDEEAYIRAYIANMYGFYGYGMWVVIEKATGRLMGRAGLSHLEVEGAVQLELGYVIAREYQRQGYGFEVCRAVLAYAREELSFESIHCLIEQKNLPSIGLAQKLGFVYDKNVLCNGKEMQRYSKILHFS